MIPGWNDDPFSPQVTLLIWILGILLSWGAIVGGVGLLIWAL